MINIRYAEYNDFALILKIDASISNEKWKRWTDNRQAIFAFDNSEFLGWLQYNYFIEKYPFINRLYVFEQYQNNGAGTKLIQFWESEMKSKGETRLMLSTESDNYGARRLYERLGFKCVGELNLRPQNQELVMLKEI